MEKLGVENLKVLVKFVVDLGESVDKAMEDKKINIMDLPLVMPLLAQVDDVAGAAKLVMPEAKDLDAEEMKVLVAFAKDELSLKEEKVEAVIEKALEVGAKIFEIVAYVKVVAAEVKALKA